MQDSKEYNEDINNSVDLPFYLKNEIFNLSFSIFGLIFMGSIAKHTKDWFAIAAAGMSFGYIIMQINLIARILLKKYY